MSFVFKGKDADLDVAKILFFWDGSEIAQPASSGGLTLAYRPRDSTILVANVYIRDEMRFLGTAYFKAEDMVSGAPLTSPVKRVVQGGRQKESGRLTISNYERPRAEDVPQGGYLVDYIFKNGGGVPTGLQSFKDHNRSWNGLNMAVPVIKNFRMPFWQFNANEAVPGVMFPTFHPVSPTGPEASLRAAAIAIERAGATVADLKNGTHLGLVAMAWYHCAYCHCVPYSLEENPILGKGVPVEYFSTPSLRDTGDCEDMSWAIGNSCRELVSLVVPGGPEYSVLRDIQRLNSYYHPFMILGAATDASPDQKVRTGKMMAHMYVVMFPYDMLAKTGLHLPQHKPRSMPSGLPALLVEGTGTVWPFQDDRCYPPFFSGGGKALSDALIRDHDTPPPVRRVIFSPATKENDYRVAEFYLNVVSGVSPYRDVGMYAFLNKEKNPKVGPLLHDILRSGAGAFDLKYIDGTRQTDWPPGEQKAMQLVLRLHQPTMPRYVSSLPIKNAGSFLKKLKKVTSVYIGNQSGVFIPSQGRNNSTRFFFSAHDIGSLNEKEFLSRLEKEIGTQASHVRMVAHEISGVGSIMLDVSW